jgi:hypothetical protein
MPVIVELHFQASKDPRSLAVGAFATQHNEAAAKLSWERTVAFFKKHLA